jgi:hypothetical protein
MQRRPSRRGGGLPVLRARRTLPHDLLGFVDLETRYFQVFQDTLGKLLPRVVCHVILQEPTQEMAATRGRKADRECKLVTKGAVIHAHVLDLFPPVIARRGGAVKVNQLPTGSSAG